jgi:hypothetical protein
MVAESELLTPTFLSNMIELSKAMLAPSIALFAAYIGYQQWSTAKRKLDMELFDRRFHVYQETQKLLGIVVRDANISFDDLRSFLRATPQAEFLFGPEIKSYLDEIYKRGVDLHYWKSQYRDSTQETPPNYDHGKVVDAMHKQNLWFLDQIEKVSVPFKKYLNISR